MGSSKKYGPESPEAGGNSRGASVPKEGHRDPIAESSLDRGMGVFWANQGIDGVTIEWHLREAIKSQMEVLTGEVDGWGVHPGKHFSLAPSVIPCPATVNEGSSCAVSWPLCIWLPNDGISVLWTESSGTLSRSLLL